MSAEQCRKVANQLRSNMEALAALGAGLAHIAHPDRAPAAIDPKVHAVIDILAPKALESVSPLEAESIRASIVSFFRQSMDLLENPFAERDWSQIDPETLQAQGLGSVVYTRMFADFAEDHPEWSIQLDNGGQFLDVGCGVGHIALSMARRWPTLRVHGIDVLDAALSIAEQNRAIDAAADRVTFQNLNFADLDEMDEYCGAFIAGAFIPEQAAVPGIQKLFKVLQPGGWVFYGLYRSPPDPLSRAVTDLRLARSGGHLWATQDIQDLLLDAGFTNLETVENESVAMFVAGQKT